MEQLPYYTLVPGEVAQGHILIVRFYFQFVHVLLSFLFLIKSVFKSSQGKCSFRGLYAYKITLYFHVTKTLFIYVFSIILLPTSFKVQPIKTLHITHTSQNNNKTFSIQAPWVKIEAKITKVYYLLILDKNLSRLKVLSQK